MVKRIFLPLLLLGLLCACAPQPAPQPLQLEELDVVGQMDLQYAQQFSVDYLAGGYALITIQQSGQYLLVPEGKQPPQGLGQEVILLPQPLAQVYLTATSAMCLFDALDALDAIALSGTQAEGWYIPNARAAMEAGEILYAGKYSAPDYELLLEEGCALSVQSTMIYHAPQVKEKLESLGIPVLVERSSYEQHPLGRTEWIKLYGLLCGKEELAAQLFDQQVDYLQSVSPQPTGKTVAFFYLSSTGNVVARKTGDYAVKMIELAGGEYVFADLGDPESAVGSVNMEMEQFYAQAKDADIILYNTTIDAQVDTLSQLLEKSPLLEDFKAVKTGDVWCTGKNLFQETTQFGRMMAELNAIFTGDWDKLDHSQTYYDKLR